MLREPRLSPGGTWLDMRVRCVEMQGLLHWFGRGLGRDRKGSFMLHLCHGETSNCRQVEKGKVSELHTDTLRVIELKDLGNRIGDWWRSEPATGP